MMNYLEVKLEENQEETVDTNSFISSVIEDQETLGTKIKIRNFKNEELLNLGFNFNATTKGYYISKNLSYDEIYNLTYEVNKLENHILTHSFLIFKIHEERLYIWDTSLIYEGVDTFEYCLSHHNIFKLGKINIITNSDNINEEILNFAGFTKRFTQPELSFITNSCYWDKKEACKVLRHFICDINEYIHIDKANEFK